MPSIFLLDLNTQVEVLSFRLRISRSPGFFAKVHTQPNIWTKSFIAAVLINYLEFGSSRFDSSRFDTNSSGEIAQKFRSIQV